MERIQLEAEQFATMMYDLWDEGGSGVLSRSAFDRAAHMHPLLVQAFQLEQLDLPASTPRDSTTTSPLGGAQVRQKSPSHHTASQYSTTQHNTAHKSPHLPSPAITCHHLPSPAITCHHLPSPSIVFPQVRQKNGIYLGLRPGAIAQLDNSYFGSQTEPRTRRSDVSQKYNAG